MKFSTGRWPLAGRASLFAVLCVMPIAGCGDDLSDTNQQHEPSVVIRWAASRSDVVGYNVYRVSPGGVSGKLSTAIVRDTKYVDNTVESERFYSYFVTSVNAKGLESEPSERIDIQVAKPQISSTLSRFFARIRGAHSSTPVP